MTWFAKDRKSRRGARSERLEEAIRATREATSGPVRLSGVARERIIEACLHAPQPESADFPALFAPARRLVVAGALPLVLAAAFVGMMGRSVQQDPGKAVRLAVSKQGDEVRFSIANGGRTHRVVRSTSPDRFDPAEAVHVTDGEFVDRVSDPSNIVFYRID